MVKNFEEHILYISLWLCGLIAKRPLAYITIIKLVYVLLCWSTCFCVGLRVFPPDTCSRHNA